MAERETLEVDVLIVGAGPAGLACAIRLRDWADAHNRNNPSAGIEPPNVLVIEKGVSVGAHSISGAVFDARVLGEMLPGWEREGAPLKQKVTREEIWLMSPQRKRKLPHALIPPYLHNNGNYIVALGELTPWLADQARKRGVEVLEGVAGAELLMDGERVLGVRCQDTGLEKDGTPGDNYMPGADLRAKVTIFAEGARGSLTKQLIKRAGLDAGRHPQTYAIGIKELWELPSANFPAGMVVHTLGYPLQKGPLSGFSGAFGGSFIYGLDATRLVIGLVVGLDYADPSLDPHNEFNRLKTHPEIKKLLAGGKAIAYGAKAIPEGGYYTLPQFYGDGFCVIGDSASMLNAARLKGVHLAMKSGMLAAEASVEALVAKNFSRWQLKRYDDLFAASWAREELFRVRNWRAGYARGIVPGMIHDLAQRLTRGRGFADPLSTPEDFKTLKKIDSKPEPEAVKPDGALTFDKVSDVFLSGTNHGETQPCHLKVPDLKLCVERCSVEYGNPCRHFCPAAVYEWIGEGPQGHLRINAGNCVHCKTCDIKDPYENIMWVVPEGGDWGPRYNRL